MPARPDAHHDRHDHHDQGTGPLPHLHLHQFPALPKRRRAHKLRRARVHRRENNDHRLCGGLLPQEDSHRHRTVPLRADMQDRVRDHGGGDQDRGMLVVRDEVRGDFEIEVRRWESHFDVRL